MTENKKLQKWNQSCMRFSQAGLALRLLIVVLGLTALGHAGLELRRSQPWPEPQSIEVPEPDSEQELRDMASVVCSH